MSAGRYVAVSTSWNHFVDPRKDGWLQPRLDCGEMPVGTTVASVAESTRGGRYENQWLGLAFPSASIARDWVSRQCEEWDESPDDYPRFSTIRALESHLDDVSMSAYLGLR